MLIAVLFSFEEAHSNEVLSFQGMTPSDSFSCRSDTNIPCLESTLNLSFHDFFPDRLPIHTPLLRLSQDSPSSWVTMIILFFFISLNLLLHHLGTVLHCHGRYSKSLETIDFTDEEEYAKLARHEFRPRYGPRASMPQEKPYHLYRSTVY